MHRINHPFASEPSGGVSLLLFLTLRVRSFTSAGVTARQRWSRSHGRKRNGSREDSHTRSVRWPAPLRASALKEQISLKEYTGDRVFLKMSYHPCVSGCGRSLAPQDGHDHCLTCLGIQHAEDAFVDGSCSSCGDMTISELRNRLRCVKHGRVPLPLPRSGVRPGTKRGGTASGGVRGDLRITVRASPSGVSHPSGTPQPAGVPLVRTGASAEWGTPPVSFGASPDDQMSVAASEGEPSLSGDDDSAALPPSALHAMALLQVHQAKALRDLHEGGHDLAVLHELRAATDLAFRATKVTAQSLGRAMSTLVVQERHLWLCLTDMKEQEKVQFLNAPVSQTGLFGDAVESCAQQFSAAQKQTEAIKHIMRRRKPAAASTPAAAPQPACRRGRPPVAAPAPTPRQQPSTVRRRGAGHRQDAQPVQAPARPGGKRKCKRP